eukprot:29625-Chlamydomonas_euryale.AAC.2
MDNVMEDTESVRRSNDDNPLPMIRRQAERGSKALLAVGWVREDSRGGRGQYKGAASKGPMCRYWSRATIHSARSLQKGDGMVGEGPLKRHGEEL